MVTKLKRSKSNKSITCETKKPADNPKILSDNPKILSDNPKILSDNPILSFPLFDGWVSRDNTQFSLTRFYKDCPNRIYTGISGETRFRQITENELDTYWGEQELTLNASKIFDLPKGKLYKLKITAVLEEETHNSIFEKDKLK